MLFCNSGYCWTAQWQPANGEAAFKSAHDTPPPEECQVLRLHPEKGFETLRR